MLAGQSFAGMMLRDRVQRLRSQRNGQGPMKKFYEAVKRAVDNDDPINMYLYEISRQISKIMCIIRNGDFHAVL